MDGLVPGRQFGECSPCFGAMRPNSHLENFTSFYPEPSVLLSRLSAHLLGAQPSVGGAGDHRTEQRALHLGWDSGLGHRGRDWVFGLVRWGRQHICLAWEETGGPSPWPCLLGPLSVPYLLPPPGLAHTVFSFSPPLPPSPTFLLHSVALLQIPPQTTTHSACHSPAFPETPGDKGPARPSA